mgnify:CR=1 FL=1
MIKHYERAGANRDAPAGPVPVGRMILRSFERLHSGTWQTGREHGSPLWPGGKRSHNSNPSYGEIRPQSDMV